jgi:tetratricopeptide (TPR) repeat protein
MNFSPEMFNQMKGMMNPQMMRQAADGIANMNDEQLKTYLNSCGMGHIAPDTFRSMSKNMKGMQDNDLEKLKDQNPYANPMFNRQNSTTTPTTTTPNTSNDFKRSNTFSNSSGNSSMYDNIQFEKKTVIDKLEAIKKAGNDHFRANKYKEACEKYYEALNELEYVPDSDKSNFKKELEDMEMLCRLNIANSKLKLEDYDLVIHECLKVLKKTENFKAHYRAGVAYYKKGNHSKALHHFNKARDVNKSEEAQQVEKYILDCQKFVEEGEADGKVKEEVKTFEVSINEVKNESENAVNKNEIITGNEIKPEKKNETENNEKKPSTKRDKLKDIVDKEVDGVKENNTKTNNVNKKSEDEIVVEEVKPTKTAERVKEQVKQEVSTGTPKTVDKDMINQATSQIKNMKDEELSNVTSMFKGMDNSMIKNMMQMQGMNMSDDQINMMKNNINPDMFKMMANNPDLMENAAKFNMNNMNANINNNNNTNSTSQPRETRRETSIDREESSFGGMEQNSNKTNSNTSLSNNNGNNNSGNNSASPMPFPGLGNMDMSSMLKFVQSNPEMMKMMGPQMSSMMGGGSQGGNPDMMMNAMQNILWVMSIPSRIKAFFKSTRGMIFLACAIILIIAYFYR